MLKAIRKSAVMESTQAKRERRTVQSVWMVSREYEGLAGAGGVKDVTRQLAEALVAAGQVKVSVILPRYGFLDVAQAGFTPLPVTAQSAMIGGHRAEHAFAVDMDYTQEERREDVAIWQRLLNGVIIYLVEADRFAEKLGVYTYTEVDEQRQPWQVKGEGHYDYFAMNVLLQKAALDLMILLEAHPDVIHCQDGHAAILPAMMRENCGYRHYFRSTAAVITIHNAGIGYHQEVGDVHFVRAVTGLPQRVIDASLLNGAFDPFLAAAPYALLNTVSENYARELQETVEDRRTGWLGHALLERQVHLAGITNGIDPHTFDPTQPEVLQLVAGFDVRNAQLEGKRRCKGALLKHLQNQAYGDRLVQHGTLPCQLDVPLCVFIGRLTAQKGVDLLIAAMDTLIATDTHCSFLVFGSGSAAYEQQLIRLAEQGQGRMCFLKGFDPVVANSVYAAGDLFLIPSRYEPCGLTDYIAQLLGTLPVVHHVGGLVKVIDEETGFAYSGESVTALVCALTRALDVYRHDPDRFKKMQQNAVERIEQLHTWKQVMVAYQSLYLQAMEQCP